MELVDTYNNDYIQQTQQKHKEGTLPPIKGKNTVLEYKDKDIGEIAECGFLKIIRSLKNNKKQMQELRFKT